MRNRATLAQLDKMDKKAIESLSISDLELLLEELAADQALTKARDAVLYSEMSRRFKNQAAELRRKKGDDTGRIKITVGATEIECDLPKKVEWGQEALAKAFALVRDEWKERPEEYVEVKYSVPENRWKAWSSTIKAAFADARVVSYGKEKFSFVAADDKKKAA